MGAPVLCVCGLLSYRGEHNVVGDGGETLSEPSHWQNGSACTRSYLVISGVPLERWMVKWANLGFRHKAGKTAGVAPRLCSRSPMTIKEQSDC
jgi:hypothetical protein